MNTVVCTLYEGTFDVGAAALINSLHASGFRGRIVVGYRGPAPRWAYAGADRAPDAFEYSPVSGIDVEFLRLGTPVHFTVYKPEFMLEVMDRYVDAEAVAYVDPDIVFKAKWWFVEDWIAAGVALVEDVNSPFSLTHPKRAAWRRLAESIGLHYAPREEFYVNGGFVGLTRGRLGFAKMWKDLIDAVRQMNDRVDSDGMTISEDPNYYLRLPDQDCLNIATGVFHDYSIIEKPGMDFAPGGNVMSHAIGKDKPWQRNFLKTLVRSGARPRLCDKEFWKHTSYPIEIFSPGVRKRRLRQIRVSSAAGRLLGR